MGLLKPEDVQAKWIGLDGPMTYPVKTRSPAVPLTFDGCAWVWAAEPGVNATRNAPEGTRFFRQYSDDSRGTRRFAGRDS